MKNCTGFENIAQILWSFKAAHQGGGGRHVKKGSQ